MSDSTRVGTAKWDEKNKRWRISVMRDGVRKSFYSSTAGRSGQKEANAKADEWLKSQTNGKKLRVHECYARFLKDHECKVESATHLTVERVFVSSIKNVLPDCYIGDLTEQHLQNVINRGTKKGNSKAYLNMIRWQLSAFCKFCRKNRWSNLNTEFIEIPKNAKTGSKKILQPHDLEVLFSSDNTLDYGKEVKDIYINAYRFQVLTGLRPEEVLGLKPEDIADGKCTLVRGINGYGHVTNLKNNNARRTFMLGEMAQSVVADQMRFRMNHVCSEYLFSIPTQALYRRHLSIYCRYNGITEVTPYELRHTFISIIRGSELSENLIKSQVGHSKSMDTFGIYGHAVDGDLEQTAYAINERFSQLLG